MNHAFWLPLSRRSLLQLLCLPAWVGVSPLLEAQNTTDDVDRARLLRSNSNLRLNGQVSPEGEQEGYAAESPNDPDLGEQRILKRQEQYQPFTLSIAAPMYYTSNVALVREGEQGDLLIAPAFSIGYRPRITKTFFGEFSLQEQWFYYDEFTQFDFASFDAIAGFVYYLPQLHYLTLRAHYDYNRFTGTGDFRAFFSQHSLLFNAEVPFRFGRAQQLSFGAEARVSLDADPEGPERDDYEGYVGYSVNLSRSFSLTATGRLAVRDYRVGDRTDVSEIFGLSANYRIREWLSISAISTFAWNQSNHSVFDYSVINIGGGVGVNAKF